MSKIQPVVLADAMKAILDHAADKKRSFNESIELHVNLKNYDTQKDKRFSGSIPLPHVARPRMSVCIIGDAYHYEQAARHDIPKINDMRSTIKFQLKKVLNLGIVVGHVEMTAEDLRQNILKSINFLVSLLKKNWQNVKSLYIKSTFGPGQRIY